MCACVDNYTAIWREKKGGLLELIWWNGNIWEIWVTIIEEILCAIFSNSKIVLQ